MELISARGGEVYSASSSSRFTIRKRPAADPPLLETCTVPQRRRKHHCSAVVSARRLFVSTSLLSARPCSSVHAEARGASQILGYYVRRSRSSLVDFMYKAQKIVIPCSALLTGSFPIPGYKSTTETLLSLMRKSAAGMGNRVSCESGANLWISFHCSQSA